MLKKLFTLFSVQEKKRIYFIVSIMVTTAIVDAFGVASIMPFIAVLSNPSVITSNIYLSELYSLTGIVSERNFLFFHNGAKNQCFSIPGITAKCSVSLSKNL